MIKNSNRTRSPEHLEPRSKRQKLDCGQPLNEQEIKKISGVEELLGSNSVCVICESNLSNTTRVRDMQSDVVLCLDCLLKGKTKEGVQHKPDCEYFIYDRLNFPLVLPDWTAQETLRLIQGIMKCGMGNWTAVAQEFVKTKNEQQCEEFYLGSLYKPGLNGISYDHVLLERDFSESNQHMFNARSVQDYQSKIEAYNLETKEFKEQEAREFDQINLDTNNSIASDTNQNQHQRHLKNNQRREINQKKDQQDVLGYQPKRGDFDQEYDMDAELLLADMEFHEDDTPENIKLKESVVELYNARLDERIRRKKFVIERGLLDLKAVQRAERKYSKEEREIVNKLKIFARFNTKEDHERFVASIIKERLLKNAIEQLKYFKSKGLNTLDQIEKFIEKEKVNTKSIYENDKNRSSKIQKIEDLEDFQDFVAEPEKKVLNVKPFNVKPTYQTQHSDDPKWVSLSNKEKAFVTDVNMKPTTYCNIKRQIQLEQVKNNKIRQSMLLNNVSKSVSSEDPMRVELVYQFVLKVNLLGPN